MNDRLWAPRLLVPKGGGALFLFVLATILCGSTGCASFNTLAIGEALTVGDGRVGSALALEAGQGTGGAERTKSSFINWRGRGVVSPSRQQVGALLGYSQLHWMGPRAPLWLGIDTGLGVEHISFDSDNNNGVVFIEPLFEGRIGTGFILEEENEPLPPLNPWGAEANPPRPPYMEADRIVHEEQERVLRKRSLLTLTIVVDADTRLTRDPLYVFALMIGIANVEEPRKRRY